MPKAARTRMRGTGAAGDAARAAHKANSAGGPGAAGMVDRRTGGRQRGKTGVSTATTPRRSTPTSSTSSTRWGARTWTRTPGRPI